MTHVVQGEVGPVIPVSDIATARAFYEGRLGLRGSETPGGGYRLDAGGATRVYLLELPQDAGRATWPVASFQVTDVDAAVKELTEAGPRPVGITVPSVSLDRDRPHLHAPVVGLGAG